MDQLQNGRSLAHSLVLLRQIQNELIETSTMMILKMLTITTSNLVKVDD